MEALVLSWVDTKRLGKPHGPKRRVRMVRSLIFLLLSMMVRRRPK